MCLQNTVIYSPRWNWDGDRIVPEMIVPSGRLVVGGRKQYLADVREYLASGQNAVLRRTISRDVQKLVRRLHGILKCQIDSSSSGYGGRRPGRAEIWQRT
ncbi:MAG: hypothetical protein WCK27_13330 [Verrucomicrobiota bacterium]